MNKKIWAIGIFVTVGSLLSACHSAQTNPAQTDSVKKRASADVFFDDFSYQTMSSFNGHGWKARTETGHPGIPGATWSGKGISFHADVAGSKNGVVRMSSVTDGTAKNTRQTQFCHARKYREGTYAARIFFRDEPTYGPDGDEVIQTFYAISPLKAPMDKDYSETDFEYLPNGGWGEAAEPAMWTTSWDTFQLEPWTKVNEYTRKAKSYAGWHTVVLNVLDEKVRYFVDGELFAEHSDAVYPEDFMSMNFNLWFMPKGADGSLGPVDSPAMREYQEDIDWVFHKAGVALSTEEVSALVRDFRSTKVTYVDNVKEQNPPLPSPCGL